MSDEAAPITVVATCHTEGCPMDGVAVTCTVYANAAPPVYRVVCGQCGQPITDIVAAA